MKDNAAITCDDAYYGVNAQCAECTIDGSECTKCKAGYYLKDSMTCSNCAGDISYCSECDDASTCTLCNDGYTVEGGLCYLCDKYLY